VTRPFRMRYGADLHNNRGINCDPPIDDSDVANKIWTEEQIAAQSRLRGVFYPDFDGQENPDPDLDQFTPNVDIFTADYWITALSGRAASGPTALQELSADDRVVANVSNGGVQSITLNPAAPTGLLPSEVYRFDPADPAYTGNGRSLGILLFTDGTGTVNAQAIVNNGYNYQAGDVINGTIPNTFLNSIATFGAVTPAAFQLNPDTTYYTADITGGTGVGARANFRTDATGTGIAAVYILGRGNAYTAGDVLTVEIEGQTIGTIPVNTVFTGTDVACQVTVGTIALDVGWDIINGPGLTRPQADRDYLRLDGQNQPSRDIYWNNQQLKDLADPTDEQDAVNLRTLRTASSAIRWLVTQTPNPFLTGILYGAYYDEATQLYAIARPIQGNFAQFLAYNGPTMAPDEIWIYRLGNFNDLTASGPIGTIYYLQFDSGTVTTTRPSNGQPAQMLAQKLDTFGFYVNPGPIIAT